MMAHGAPHSHFPWRAPRQSDWLERWQEADALVRGLPANGAASEVCIALRRLVGQQIAMQEHLKLQNSARRLLPHADILPLRHVRIGLIGNRTLSYLINPLRAEGLARGLLIDAVEASYDSIAGFALGPANPFGVEKLDAVVVILDERAFAHERRLLDHAAEAHAGAEAASFLSAVAQAAREKLGATPVVATIPSVGSRISSSDLALTGSVERFVMHLNATIVDGAQKREWIVWDLASLASRVGLEAWFDPVRFWEAKVPFRIELSSLVADHLSRILAALAGKTCRALVLDLDNTLWGGVIGDDGLSGIRLGQNSPEGEAYLAFQQFVLQLRTRGVVIAVSSKNMDETAREPFRAHPEMLLKEEHIAVFQANWEDKASNVKAIADTLGLGLESIAFVDDNPAERERVRRELPLVSVPEIGSDPAYYPVRIADSGIFEHLLLNADDMGRAASYQSHAARVELQSKVGNFEDYLRSLEMVLSVGRFDPIGLPRIAQLVNKSNQFNLTTRRYSEEDVRRFEKDEAGTLCWQVRLDDKFSGHGMIAVVIVRKAEKVWTIDTWLMSCRVLMRGVEDTLMNLLMSEARENGVEEVVGEYIPTPRNEMVADFYDRFGFARSHEAPDVVRYSADPGRFEPAKTFVTVKML